MRIRRETRPERATADFGNGPDDVVGERCEVGEMRDAMDFSGFRRAAKRHPSHHDHASPPIAPVPGEMKPSDLVGFASSPVIHDDERMIDVTVPLNAWMTKVVEGADRQGG